MTFSKIALPLGLVAAFATAAFAQDADPVAERQELMKTIRGASATIGNMVKGDTAFDAAAAEEAKQVLVTSAGEIPAAFETEAMGGDTEALPAIWEQWDTFTADAEAMGTAAGDLDTSSLEAMQAGFRSVGQSCGACHQSFRE